MPAGRPSEYNDQTVSKVREYLDSCEDKEEQVISGESEKFTAFKQKLRVNLPTIDGLAVFLGVSRETIYDWERKFPEFSDIINDLRAKQARELVNKGLSGDYNPIIAKVLLSKHGYREATENESTVRGSIDFGNAK